MHPRLRANPVVLTCLFAGLLAGRGAGAVEARPPVNSAAAGTSELAVYPPRITLARGKTHRLLVTAVPPDGFEADATGKAKLASDHPEVVAVESGGVLRGITAGTATITATLNGKSTVAEVSVPAAASDNGISFINDVMPVLSRAGCNAGSCHAKPEGQNGFKLSVFAYDLKGDYKAIVKGDRGRRIFPAAPEESLLLLKPTQQVKHGGGQRFPVDSEPYRLLKTWIEQGLPYSQPTDAALVGLDVYPSERRYHKRAKQRLLVTARYADGSVRDVTDLADFSSNEKEIAKVQEGGLVTVGDVGGEGVVIARFMGLVAISRITVPADRALPDSTYGSLPENNFIDSAVYARLKRLGLFPSDGCTDSEFIRRASLDAIGVLPTPADVQAFVSDANPDKRERLVDRLLASPAYADYWATKWGDLLRPNTQRVGVKPVYLLDQWLRQSFRANKPYDQFVREILTAEGSTHRYGPVVLFRDRREPADIAPMVSQLFMGVRIECARCHHHPNEKWSQSDFYQLAAFFSQLQRKGQGISAPISGEAEFIWFGQAAPVKHPLTGEAMKPKPPDGPEPDISPDQDPRAAFADWLTRPDNPFFARAIVNRVWGELMGRGIVHPVDDFRSSNPPTNERLLNELAADFTAHGYDLKHLIRTIMASHAYQLSSLPNDTNVADTRNFSRSYRRRLPAEALLDAVCDLTDVREPLEGLPPGARAVQTWNNKLNSEFLDAFSRPNSSADPPCERDRGTSVIQALHLMNSTKLQAKIASPEGRAAKLAKSKMEPEEIVKELYLAAYARLPDEEELKIATEAYSAPGATRQSATEDVMWALINSAEFVFNH